MIAKAIEIAAFRWRAPAWAILVVLAVGLHPSPAVGCPACSESLPNAAVEPGDSAPPAALIVSAPTRKVGGSLAHGFYYSILLLLAVPFFAVAAMGTVLWVQLHRRADQHPVVPSV